MNLYAGSDGRFYTDQEVTWRFENDEWRACMWDTEVGWELVEDGTELVRLDPVEREELPGWAELRPEGRGFVVVDLREEGDDDPEGPDPMVGDTTG